MIRPGNVMAALDALGIRYVVHGDEATASCPFHEDGRRPNWSCNLISGMHNCFSCGNGGSFPRLVQHVLGGSRRSAEDWCSGFQRDFGEVMAWRSRDEDSQAPRIPHVYTESDLALFTFPPASALAQRQISAKAATDYGVLWDADSGRWILPIRDPFKGKLWGWQEKGPEWFRNRPKGVPKGEALFGLQRVPEGAAAVLVESPLDVLRIADAGLDAWPVASYGAEVTEYQIGLIVDRCSRLIGAMDDDAAGDRASEKLQQERRIPVSFFHFGKSRAKDPGEMTDEQIRWGAGHALPGFLVRF